MVLDFFDKKVVETAGSHLRLEVFAAKVWTEAVLFQSLAYLELFFLVLLMVVGWFFCFVGLFCLFVCLYLFVCGVFCFFLLCVLFNTDNLLSLNQVLPESKSYIPLMNMTGHLTETDHSDVFLIALKPLILPCACTFKASFILCLFFYDPLLKYHLSSMAFRLWFPKKQKNVFLASPWQV